MKNLEVHPEKTEYLHESSEITEKDLIYISRIKYRINE